MKKMLVLIVLLALVGAGGWFAFAVAGPEHDLLVRLEEDAHREWAQVDALLLRRNDVVANIVAVVQQSASTEKDVLATASAAIAGYRSSGADPADRIEAAKRADAASLRIVSLGRAYPDVKSNASFDRLVTELVKTEDAIAAQRMAYNNAVSTLNAEVKSVRGLLVSKLDGVAAGAYYDLPSNVSKDAPSIGHDATGGLEAKASSSSSKSPLEGLKLQGVIESDGRATAMLQYPNGRAFTVHTGQAVLELNATVKDIGAGSVTFEERTVAADGNVAVRLVEIGR